MSAEKAREQRGSSGNLPQLANYTAATELVLANMTAAAMGGVLGVKQKATLESCPGAEGSPF